MSPQRYLRLVAAMAAATMVIGAQAAQPAGATVTGQRSGASPAALAKTHVWAWGKGKFGLIGNHTTHTLATPTKIKLSGITSISSVNSNTYAVRSDGTVWAWGGDSFGNLGNGTFNDAVIDYPVQVSGLTDVIAVTAQASGAYALRADGTVWGWGDNTYGQLEDGTTTDRAVPVQVQGLTDVTAISSAGYPGVSALRSDGTVWQTALTGVTQLAGYDDAVAIASGEGDTVALRADGTVIARTGNGPKYEDGPLPVAGLSSVVAVAASSGAYYALRSDSTVWAWGADQFDQVSPLAKKVFVPTQVPGMTDITQISAGYGAALALRSDGTVWAQGYYVSGGTPDLQQITAPAGVIGVFAGDRTWYLLVS